MVNFVWGRLSLGENYLSIVVLGFELRASGTLPLEPYLQPKHGELTLNGISQLQKDKCMIPFMR
jgi:hypothetical protein